MAEPPLKGKPNPKTLTRDLEGERKTVNAYTSAYLRTTYPFPKNLDRF